MCNGNPVLVAIVPTCLLARFFYVGSFFLCSVEAIAASTEFSNKNFDQDICDQKAYLYFNSSSLSNCLEKKLFSTHNYEENIVNSFDYNSVEFSINNKRFSQKIDRLTSNKPLELADNSSISKAVKTDSKLALDITSDTQSWEEDNLFIAEGNARAIINGRNLRSDRIEFDRSNNIIIATGNVSLYSGSNYFYASSLLYDLNTKEAHIADAYGVIDIKLLSKELNFVDPIDFDNLNHIQEDLPKAIDVKWKDRFTIKSGFDADMKVITKDEENENHSKKWRVKASNIVITTSGWKANEAVFTNDPFNPAQIKIYAYKVELKEGTDGLDNATISADRSHIKFEDKVKLPLGSRKFQLGRRGFLKRWTFGIDGYDRDGFFIGRQFRPIEFDDNFKLTIQPQYLIQRSIVGKTDAYPRDGESVNSAKVSTNTSFADLFGLEAKLQGKIFKWDSEFDAKITTFNKKKFANGSRYSASLKKEFDLKNIKKLTANAFASYRYNVFNGSIGRSDIYTSYGININKKGSWKSGKTSFNYNLGGGLGNYQAERLRTIDLISSWRASLFSSLSIKRPLKSFNSNDTSEYSISAYSPKELDPGLYISSSISSKYFIYKDGDYQSTLSLGLGPEIVLGKLKKKYFDYTKLSIMASTTIKGGDSPFKFDNASDLRTIKFDFTQQLAGPLIIKHLEEYNIDSNSDNYGKSINSKLALMWQRRAYEFGLFYNFRNQSGGISFALNGFTYDGHPPSF